MSNKSLSQQKVKVTKAKKAYSRGSYNLNFMKYKYLFLLVSLLAIAGSAFFTLTKGLNLGVDFTGGKVVEFMVEDNNIKFDELRANINKFAEANNLGEVSLQTLDGDNNFTLKMVNNKTTKPANSETDNNLNKNRELMDSLKANLNEFFGHDVTIRRVDFVGPQIGGELVLQGATALGLAVLGMLIYIALRFEFSFAFGAIIALVHDVIIVFGLYSFLAIEFNVTSIAAILTIIGYSINDSVVIYDRIRENIIRYSNLPLIEIINTSVNETLSRTILTAGTTLVAVLALLLVGGSALYGLSLAVLAGIIVGTYSSIFIASSVLLLIRKGKSI